MDGMVIAADKVGELSSKLADFIAVKLEERREAADFENGFVSDGEESENSFEEAISDAADNVEDICKDACDAAKDVADSIADAAEDLSESGDEE